MPEEPSPVWPGAPRYGPPDPFPPYRFVAGLHPHPVRDPAGHSHGPERPASHVPAERWREDEDYLRGIDLYHAGYLWEAHEAWEGIWKASPDPRQRDLLQGLIQLTAAALKAHMGEPQGARTLAQRARERLTRAARPSPHYMGLDLAALLTTLDPTRPPPLRLS